jgi:antitoxin HicB
MTTYPAIFHPDEKGYWVEFPDLPGCVTEGETLEDAKEMAKEALSAMLESLDSRKKSIPIPSNIKGNDIHYIEPSLNVAFAISLKREREKMGLTQKQVAEKANITWSFYQRIENPRKSNPTLSTIEKLRKIFPLSNFQFI